MRTAANVACRCLGVALLGLVLYSVIEPIWVYGCIWAPNTRNIAFFWYGLATPFNNHPVMGAVSLILAALLVSLTFLVRRASTFISRHLAEATGLFVVLIALNILIMYPVARRSYLEAKGIHTSVSRMERADAMFSHLSGEKPDIPSSAYFVYLDKGRIESLYSEVEPSWLNRQRTLSRSTHSTMDAQVGPLSAGESGGQRTQTIQEPPHATPERACLAFMKYTVERGQATNFSTSVVWFIMSLGSTASRSIYGAGRKVPFPITPAQIADEEGLEPKGDVGSTPEEVRRANQEIAKHNWKAEMQARLAQPPPYVFVTGVFEEHTSPVPCLVHPYTAPDGTYGLKGDVFRPVRFRVVFPRSTPFKEIRNGARMKGTVFGKIVHPLDKQGVVEVRALAIYQ